MISGFTLGMFRLILNVVYGTKAGLVVESEKYIQKLKYITESLKGQVVDGVNGLSTKIGDVLGTAGDQFRGFVDQASAAITAGNYSEATTALGSARDGMEHLFVQKYGFLYHVAAINWLHYTVLLFFFCIATIVIISLLTNKPTAQQLNFTFAAATHEEKAAVRASWTVWDVVLSLIVVAVVVTFYIYFWH